MANTNCSFSKFNDLLGIQEVISSSLVSGIEEQKNLPDIIQDVKDKYLVHYYGAELSGLGENAEDKLQALSEVGEAVKLVFDSLASDKPATAPDGSRMPSKYEQLGLFNDNQDTFFNNYERQVDDIVSMWSSNFTKMNSINAAHEGEIGSDFISGNPNVEDVTYEVGGVELGKMDIPMTDERLNLDKRITKHDDLTYHYFKGAMSANTKFVQEFNAALVSKSIITLDPVTGKNNRVITSNTDLDKAIKDWKSELFSSLYPEKGELYESVGSDKILRSDLPELLDQVKSEFKDSEIAVKDLLQWIQSRSPKLKRYYDYLTLSNFDTVMGMFGKGLIDIKRNLIGLNNESYNTLKYSLVGSNKLGKGNWNDNELRSAFAEQSPLYKTLIENTNQFSPQDGIKTDRFLKADQVAFSMNKLRKFIDRENFTGSMKKALENALLHNYKRTAVSTDFANEFSKIRVGIADNATYLSLYTKFFKDADIDANGKPNAFLTSLGKVGKTIMSHGISSYREVFSDFSRSGNFDLDIFKVIPATIVKTVSKAYNEISWNMKEKAYTTMMLATKMSDKQGGVFRSKLNSIGSLTSEDLFSKFNSTYNTRVEDNKIFFPVGQNHFYYDLFSEGFFKEDGSRFALRSIKSPTSYYDMMGKDGSTLDPVYKDYSHLIDIASEALNEPLKGMDFATLFQFKNTLDDGPNNAHLDALLKMASAVLYARNVKLEYIGNSTDLGFIKSRLDLVPKLIDNFNRKMDTILDNRSKTLNVAFMPKVQSAVKSYVDLLGTIRGRDVKAVTINAEGSAMPTYGQLNLMSDTHNLFRHIKASPTFDKSPLSANLFVNNEGLIKDTVIRSITDISSVGKKKSSGKLTPLETTTYDFLHDFLDPKSSSLVEQRAPIFQPTVFADKSQHTGIQMDPNQQIRINGRLFSNKKYHEYNDRDFKNLHFATMNDYYTKLSDNLLDTYNNVFQGTLKPIHVAYLEDTRILKRILNDPAFENKIDPSQPLTERNLKYNRDYYKGNLLTTEIENFNQLLSVNKTGVKSLAATDKVLNILNEKGFLRAAQANLNINSIVKEIVYSKSKKTGSIGVNKTLMKYIDDYSTPEKHEAVMEIAKAKFAANLSKMGFELQSHDIHDKENPIVRRGLTYFNISDTSNWYDKGTKTLRNHKGEVDTDGSYSHNFELNPILEHYFWEFNAITENFQNAVVGTIHGHSAKGAIDSIENEEAARLVGMYKRMVAHQATMHPYNLNVINGVPFYNRIAYVNDPSKELFNQIGETHTQDIADGSTFTLMLHRNLENNSLLDQAAAVHHKSFGTTINKFFNSAGLMKHAAHGITNERLRLSGSSENNLNNNVKRMMNEPFNIKGVPVHFDLSKDYNGRTILMSDITKGAGAFYLTRDNDLIEVTGFKNLDFTKGLYQVTETNHSNDTHNTKTVTINNLHELWHKVFGGGTDTVVDENGIVVAQGIIGTPERSVHYSQEDLQSTLANGRKGYVFGDDSWDHLTHFVNNVGYKINHKGLDTIAQEMNLPYEQLRDIINERTGKSDYSEHDDLAYPEQTSVWQPLKNHYIAQITYDSGQKVGVQNINPTSILHRDSNEKFWVSDFVSNLHTGIQLDYEHETDDSEVSEMTQIIGALGFNGDTPRYSQNVYKAIGQYIDVKMSDILPFISAKDPVSRANFYNYIAKEIVKNFATKDTMSLSNAIMYKVQDELAKQKQILVELSLQQPETAEHKIALAKLETFERESFKVPFSDSNVFNSFVTTVNTLFTKKGIKRKLSGIAAIISPHSSFVEVRDVPQYDNQGRVVGSTTVTDEGYYKWKKNTIAQPWFKEVSGKSGGEEAGILSLHHMPAKAGEVSLLDTVIHNNVVYSLDTNAKYRAFKNSVPADTDVIIHKGANRDLRPTDFRWRLGTDANRYSIYDLPHSQLAFITREITATAKDISKYGDSVTFTGMSKFEKEQKTNEVLASVTKYQNLIQEYNSLLPHTNGFLKEIKGEINAKVIPNRAIKINNKLEMEEFGDHTYKYIKNAILNDYKTIYEQKRVPLTKDHATLLVTNPEEFIKRYGTQANDLLDSYKGYANSGLVDPAQSLNNWLRTEKPSLQMSGDFEIIPGEIALPKLYKTRFGLSQDDMISDINSEFFINKLNNNAAPLAGIPHDFYVRDLNGNHIYVYLDGSANHSKMSPVMSDVEIETQPVSNMHGNVKTYRVDGNGDLMYEIGNARFKKFTQSGSVHEAIVIKDFDDLVNLQKLTLYRDSTLEDVVTNFTAGVEVAKLGLTYQKHLANNHKVSETLDRKLMFLNSITHKSADIAEKSEAIQSQLKELAEYKRNSLLENYDSEWIADQIDSIDTRINQSTSAEERSRAEFKRGVYQKYADGLNALNKMEEGDAKNAFHETVIDEVQSIHDHLLRGIGYKYDRLQGPNKETEITDFLQSLHSYQLGRSASRNERAGRERYNSFMLSLENTVARIPGQGMQSFMPMKITFFLDTEANTALVNKYNLWLTGGDFDIDKVFAVGYSFDNRGKLISWHPDFNYKTVNTLRKSLELPISDDISRVLTMQPNVDSTLLQLDDLHNIVDYYANKRNATESQFTRFVDTMNKIGASHEYHVVGLGEEHSELLTKFEELINGDPSKPSTGYFHQIANMKHGSEATLNIIAANMYQHSIDPRNAPHAFAPVDMYEPSKAADMSSKGKDIRMITHRDPSSIPVMKEGNMVGKDVIGISASSGLKAFSAITSTYMNATKGDFDSLPFFQRIKQFVIDKEGNTKTLPEDKIVTIIGGLNFNGREQYLKSYIDGAISGRLSEEEAANYTKAILQGQETKGDVALVLSALLSAATDNAKELILGKINAGPETAGMYIRALMLGVDFSSYANMMISKESELIIKYSKQNIFNEATKDRSIKKAITILETGLIPVESYLNPQAINVVAKKLLDLAEEGVIPDSAIHKGDEDQLPYGIDIVRGVITKLDSGKLKQLIGEVNDSLGVFGDERFQTGAKVYTAKVADDEESSQLEELFGTELLGEQSDSDSDDYPFDGEFGDENTAMRSSIVKVNLAFNRLIADNIKLKEDMNFPMNKTVIQQFAHDVKATEAITVLASQLGINTGIKSDSYAAYSFFNKLETHVNSLMVDYMKVGVRQGKIYRDFVNQFGIDTVDKGFNAKRFATDPQYASQAIKNYEILKSDINILKVLDSVEHFKKMYELGVHAYSSVRNASIKSRMIDYMIDRLSERDILPSLTVYADRSLGYRGNVSQEDYSKITNFIDDVLISNFLGGLNKDPHRPSSLKPIQINKNDITVNENYDIVSASSDHTINLNNNIGRTQFTTWFENTVLSELRMGYTRDADGHRIEGAPNVELTNNFFLNQFNIDRGMDPVTKTPFIYYKLPVNMTQILSEDDKQLFDNLSSSFYTLKKFNYSGNNVVDLLYLYNLIVHRNKVTGSSLNKLFNGVADLGNASLIHDHLKFIGDLDRKVDVLKIGEYFQLNDVVQKGLAKEVTDLPTVNIKNTGEVFNTPSIVKKKIFSNGVVKDEFYVLDAGQYKQINISESALDKNIRINNGSKNLSTMITDNSLVSAKAQVTRLFDDTAAKVERLEDTCK